jgi:NitT/TauT family transport system substrate-binding protein
MKLGRSLLLALALAPLTLPSAAMAADINMVLNWVPTADHAPYFYAKSQGWYADKGIDLTIESGRGSGAAAQRVAAGASSIGVADMSTALLAKGKGANTVAVMSVYANTPQGFYWLKSSGINGPEDFPGHSIGNPPADASRVMWPLFAKTVGIDPESVKFVNITPQAKIASLKSNVIDITSDFYNEHDLKLREFGDDLGYVAWRNIGVNPYGNAVIVNPDFLANNKQMVADFVAITQKAFAACVENVDPCLDAIMKDVTGLDRDNQKDQWERIKELMRDDTTTTVALGAFSPERMASDYELVETYFSLEQPFDINDTYTNEFLATDVLMTK